MARPKEDISSLPTYWYQDILDLYKVKLGKKF